MRSRLKNASFHLLDRYFSQDSEIYYLVISPDLIKNTKLTPEIPELINMANKKGI